MLDMCAALHHVVHRPRYHAKHSYLSVLNFYRRDRRVVTFDKFWEGCLLVYTRNVRQREIVETSRACVSLPFDYRHR